MQIGFEIWTMQKDILFDNIYIGHSVSDAEKLKKETYDVKSASEKVEEAASKPKTEDKPPKSPMDLNFKDDPVLYMREKLDLFITIAKKDPVQAVKFMPEVAGAIGVAAVTVIALLVGIIGTGGAAAPSKEQVKDAAQEAKEKAVEAKDQAAEAASSGAEKVQAEVNKRTRSQKADS